MQVNDSNFIWQITESKEDPPNESNKPQANGKVNVSITNGHNVAPAVQSPRGHSSQEQRAEVSEPSTENNTSDTNLRLEAMSQDREALRVEVEQLRKSLEDIQGKHAEEISTIKSELEESEAAKEQAQSKYDNLLGRVNTIKSSLGERMAADRQELSEAKDQIEDLEKENEQLVNSRNEADAEIRRLSREAEEASKELSSLRNRHNLSQQNWLKEREELISQNITLKEEAEAARDAMSEWEILAMEERSNHNSAAERATELEEQLAGNREAYEIAASERDLQIQNVTGLQRALQEIQEARKAELREMVETSQEQISALKKLVQESDVRATTAESEKETLKKELERLAPFETDIKEKNLLIGKLRHEAIILNDHLTKALRHIKKSKPEDSVDRYVNARNFHAGNILTITTSQLVTNHILHFITLERSDPKKFQVLQLMASMLDWNEEEREKAGLARPGASNSTLKIPVSPFYRTPSTPSLSTEFFPRDSKSLSGVSGKEGKESLSDLWTDFLEKQAEEGMGKSRQGSLEAMLGRPGTSG